jgi:hypothetical protein
MVEHIGSGCPDFLSHVEGLPIDMQQRGSYRMQYHRFGILAFSSLLLIALPVFAAGPAGGMDRMLNNEGLAVLARAGYNERFLVELIQSQPGKFDTSVEGLVYLAKQGISERLVRLVIAEQKAGERRQSEASAAGETQEPMMPLTPSAAGASARAKSPIRMKVVTQKMLVPAAVNQAVGPNPVIVLEKRMFGDRYYALPGSQAPMVTPVATPRAPQSMPAAATQVASFH